MMGGKLRGDADISLVRDKPSHTVAMRLENVDFQSLTKLYFDYDNARGRVNAAYNFTGKGDDSRTMQGRGNIAVTDGDVFAIPFLGPLSGILNSIVSGLAGTCGRMLKSWSSTTSADLGSTTLIVTGSTCGLSGARVIHCTR